MGTCSDGSNTSNPCDVNHCEPNGECLADGDFYQCICKNGYTGAHCEVVPTTTTTTTKKATTTTTTSKTTETPMPECNLQGKLKRRIFLQKLAVNFHRISSIKSLTLTGDRVDIAFVVDTSGFALYKGKVPKSINFRDMKNLCRHFETLKKKQFILLSKI